MDFHVTLFQLDFACHEQVDTIVVILIAFEARRSARTCPKNIREKTKSYKISMEVHRKLF